MSCSTAGSSALTPDLISPFRFSLFPFSFPRPRIGYAYSKGAPRMTDTATKPAGSRIATFETVVVESIVETWDTRTLVLDAGPEQRSWRAGQYISIDPHQFVSLKSFIEYL